MEISSEAVRAQLALLIGRQPSYAEWDECLRRIRHSPPGLQGSETALQMLVAVHAERIVLQREVEAANCRLRNHATLQLWKAVNEIKAHLQRQVTRPFPDHKPSAGKMIPHWLAGCNRSYGHLLIAAGAGMLLMLCIILSMAKLEVLSGLRLSKEEAAVVAAFDGFEGVDRMRAVEWVATNLTTNERLDCFSAMGRTSAQAARMQSRAQVQACHRAFN